MSQTEKVVLNYPSSELPYTISDSLRKRYPYNQPTFQKDIESVKCTVFPSYGIDGLKRNINALIAPEFETKEKEKALRILFTQLFDSKTQIRVLEFGIVESLHHLLESRPSSQCDLLASKVAQRLSILNQGKEMLVRRGSIHLLLDIVMDTKAAQERVEACKAILFVARSREGVNALLRAETTTLTIVEGLVSILDIKKSQCNPQLLYITMEALIEICRTPHGRNACATANALELLNNILKRPHLGIECDTDGNCIQNAEYTITRNATHLIWNICLDGEGKRLGKDAILSLTKVLHEAIQISERPLIRLSAGALMAILVYEPSKPVVLEIAPIPHANVTPIEVFCQFLQYASENKERFVGIEPQENDTNSIENILFNVKACIRLAAEYPPVRTNVRKILKIEYLEALGL